MVNPLCLFEMIKWEKLDIHVPFTYIFVFHVLCVFAPFYFNWSAFWIAFALYVITGMGISVSYHRNLAHKSFKLSKWVEYLLAYCGVHAYQGDPISWVSIHRCHHRYVDTERDPHSPILGFWSSHITWLLDLQTLNEKVCSNYFNDSQRQERKMYMIFFKQGNPNYVADLEKQIFYRFIQKSYILHPIALAGLLYAIGGVPFFIWGWCVRIVVTLHSTFLVNSICHMWGNQQWNTGDSSKNNGLVALITFGEGWHNNHHAFEYSARHGHEWWQIDFGWYFIMFLQAVGVATDVKLPSSKPKLHRKLPIFPLPKLHLPKSSIN